MHGDSNLAGSIFDMDARETDVISARSQTPPRVNLTGAEAINSSTIFKVFYASPKL